MSDARSLIGQRHAGLIEVARAAGAAGRIVVGYIGLDVPEELILGAGMVPLRLTADLDAPASAAQRFGEGGHPVLRSLVARLLGGPYDFVDHLVVGSMPRNLTALPILINQLQGSDAAFARFRVHQLDVLHSESASAQQFTLQNISQLAATLANWADRPQSEAELRAAIALCNETRVLLRQFQQLRAAGRHQDGATALRIYGCATGVGRPDFNVSLREWLRSDALRSESATSTMSRVIYSGSATDTTALYASIESQGLCIVDDDQDFGARALGPLIDERAAPLTAIATAYAHRTPAASGWLNAERSVYLRERICACKPDGVLFYSAAYDHPPAWEYPAMQAVATAAGLTSAVLDASSYRQPALVATAARSFAQALHAAPRAVNA